MTGTCKWPYCKNAAVRQLENELEYCLDHYENVKTLQTRAERGDFKPETK